MNAKAAIAAFLFASCFAPTSGKAFPGNASYEFELPEALQEILISTLGIPEDLVREASLEIYMDPDQSTWLRACAAFHRSPEEQEVFTSLGPSRNPSSLE